MKRKTSAAGKVLKQLSKKWRSPGDRFAVFDEAGALNAVDEEGRGSATITGDLPPQLAELFDEAATAWQYVAKSFPGVSGSVRFQKAPSHVGALAMVTDDFDVLEFAFFEGDKRLTGSEATRLFAELVGSTDEFGDRQIDRLTKLHIQLGSERAILQALHQEFKERVAPIEFNGFRTLSACSGAANSLANVTYLIEFLSAQREKLKEKQYQDLSN